METQYNDALRDQVLGNQALMAKLFLVQPWVNKEDVVRLGIQDSPAAAENLLEALRDSGLITKDQRGYTCPPETLRWISEFLPSEDEADTLRRAMRSHFQPSVQEAVVRSTLNAFSPVATADHPVQRPSWYFDLNAIIHPALTIDLNLNITGCSNELCNFLRPVYPNLRADVDAGKLELETFIQGLDLRHFDYETLEPSEEHVLNSTPKFPSLLKHLADRGSVDKKPVIIGIGKVEHYLELSFALQIAFPGAQSIWHIVDRRVGQMRLIRAMRLTKWFITAHRLKQPTNLFNVARATVELLSLNCRKSNLTQQEIQTELSEVINSLSAGIEEFSRFVTEISGDEYKIATKLEESESVDVLAVLEDVITDIDFIYAKPAGVQITLKNCAPEVESHFIRASPFLLREALFNIIHNAFKHGARNASDKEIYVHCTCSMSGLVITVEDNGPGMSERERQEYAKAFEEIRTTVSPSEVGALSGLSLAMSVIKSVNGKISFENIEPGFRTTLTFDAC